MQPSGWEHRQPQLGGTTQDRSSAQDLGSRNVSEIHWLHSEASLTSILLRLQPNLFKPGQRGAVGTMGLAGGCGQRSVEEEVTLQMKGRAGIREERMAYARSPKCKEMGAVGAEER